jgi:hypothetical protein
MVKGELMNQRRHNALMKEFNKSAKQEGDSNEKQLKRQIVSAHNHEIA